MGLGTGADHGPESENTAERERSLEHAESNPHSFRPSHCKKAASGGWSTAGNLQALVSSLVLLIQGTVSLRLSICLLTVLYHKIVLRITKVQGPLYSLS